MNKLLVFLLEEESMYEVLNVLLPRILPPNVNFKLVNGYDKVRGARAIAPHLDLINNRSHSFHVFITGVQNLAQQ